MREFLIFCLAGICIVIVIIFAFSFGEQRECKRWFIYGNDKQDRLFLSWQKNQCQYYNIRLENSNGQNK